MECFLHFVWSHCHCCSLTPSWLQEGVMHSAAIPASRCIRMRPGLVARAGYWVDPVQQSCCVSFHVSYFIIDISIYYCILLVVSASVLPRTWALLEWTLDFFRTSLQVVKITLSPAKSSLSWLGALWGFGKQVVSSSLLFIIPVPRQNPAPGQIPAKSYLMCSSI